MKRMIPLLLSLLLLAGCGGNAADYHLHHPQRRGCS